MWFALIIGFIVFIVSIIIAIWWKETAIALLSPLFAIICSIIWLACSLILMCIIPTDYETYSTTSTPIYALSDTSNTQGTFFLGGGTVNSDLYYYYITKADKKGGKQIHKVAASGTTVYEDETKNPRIVVEYKHSSNPIYRFFFYSNIQKTSIYIPKNSINYKYCIDLE